MLTDSEVQTFLEGEKTNIQKEKPKVKYSVALVSVFLAAENENRRLKDFFFFLITNTILTIQYETPLTLITMLIYITLLTVTNNYTTYSIQLY